MQRAHIHNTAVIEKVLTFCEDLCAYFRSHARQVVSGTSHKQARVAAYKVPLDLWAASKLDRFMVRLLDEC